MELEVSIFSPRIIQGMKSWPGGREREAGSFRRLAGKLEFRFRRGESDVEF